MQFRAWPQERGRTLVKPPAWGQAMQPLTSERLVLRMFRESDLDAYADMCGDAEVMRYLGDGHTFSRAEAWRSMAVVIGHWQLRGFGLWAVEERSTGLLAGRVGCWQPEGWPGLEVGWALRREFWGSGYATEAALRGGRFRVQPPGARPRDQPDSAGKQRLGRRRNAAGHELRWIHRSSWASQC